MTSMDQIRLSPNVQRRHFARRGERGERLNVLVVHDQYGQTCNGVFHLDGASDEAHALLRADRLMTSDINLYAMDFPNLRLI